MNPHVVDMGTIGVLILKEVTVQWQQLCSLHDLQEANVYLLSLG